MTASSPRVAEGLAHRRQDRLGVLELVLVEVDQRQRRLGGQQEVALQPVQLVVGAGRSGRGGCRPASASIAASMAADLVGERLVAPGRLAPLVGLLLQRLEVGVDQLHLERRELLDGIATAGHVDRRRTPAARTRWHRPRGCGTGTGCPGPRPAPRPRPGRRCPRTGRWRG